MIFGLLILGSYLLGAIPFGLILTRWKANIDIRQIGSKNIGATNVLRSGHKSLAALTLLLDGMKGVIFLILYRINMPYNTSFTENRFKDELFLTAAAILGHLYPVFLRFKGGKGVATTGFCLFFLCPIVGLTATLLWGVTFLISRTSALAALVSTLLMPLYSYQFSGKYLAFWSIGIGSLIFYKHKDNIQRLFQGREKKL